MADEQATPAATPAETPAEPALAQPHKILSAVWVGGHLEVTILSPTNRVYRGFINQWHEIQPIGVATG